MRYSTVRAPLFFSCSCSDAYNIALSEKRGRSVADFLARLGMDPARLRVVPKGEAEASGTDEDSRALERRVDFKMAVEASKV